MARTRIKFCGITNPDDAQAAVEAGADALGMVFYRQAGRCVSIETAAVIVAKVPPFVATVGLFVDQPVEQVVKIAGELRLNYVQLHGHESPEVVQALKGLLVLKAVRVRAGQLTADLQLWRDAIAKLSLTNLRGILLETDSAHKGGTGEQNDWETIINARAAGAFNGLPPLIAAGGLRVETVADVVRTIRPSAVDVSSGIEITRGKKDANLMRQFVKSVREADADAESQS